MQVTVILGSNMGDKRRVIEEAAAILINKTGKMTTASSFYETEPWGFESDELFLNKIITIETALPPETFLNICLETEKQLGRIRHAESRYASRTIDIDILLYDSRIICTPNLMIPHPRMTERNFVLTPLCEIMPGFTHPVLHKTIATLLTECTDKLKAKKVTP